MQTHKDLLSYLKEISRIQTPSINQAFEAIDRTYFILPEEIPSVFIDAPLPIGYGQTNSQPSTVAMMLEWLEPQKGDRVLDIGSGSGWTTALLAHIVGSEGSVLGLERVPELVEFGQVNLASFNFKHARIEKAVSGEFGKPGELFDKILVSAAAESLPQELIEQLDINGKLVIPVQDSIYEITKLTNKKIATKIHYGFRFVPLIR